GTVWPHDNSLCAWGLARHACWPETYRIVHAMFDAAGALSNQLPEVFAGLPRSETPFPIAYPTDARQQAWATGTPELLLLLLLDAGHELTLFSSGVSRTKAELGFVYETAPSAQIGRAQVEIHHALGCFERAAEFDVINDHSGPPAAVIAGAVQTPTLHTVHGP